MRKQLSNKIRFEVFKRDSFTCQYCGSKAPDVVLNVDHINPVKEGGSNDMMNLITSCFSCNSGKKARKLSDKTVLEKQRKQIEELNEKRIQLEMMLKWKEESESLESDKLNIIIDKINDCLINCKVSESYVKKIKICIKKHGFENTYDAVSISEDTYLKDPSNSLCVDDFLSKIPGIAYYKSLSPLDSQIKKVSSYIWKIYPAENKWEIEDLLKVYSNQLKLHWDYDEEMIIDDLENQVIPCVKKTNRYTQFYFTIQEWIKQIKEE